MSGVKVGEDHQYDLPSSENVENIQEESVKTSVNSESEVSSNDSQDQASGLSEVQQTDKEIFEEFVNNDSMSQGTKLVIEESEDVKLSRSSSNDTSGTKLHEISEFEKELIKDDVIDKSSSNFEGSNVINKPSKNEIPEQSQIDLFMMDGFDDVFEGQIVPAVVSLIKKSGILVDFSYKSDGFIPTNEISDSRLKDLSVGEDIYVMIQKLETKEGYSLLSEKSARAEIIWDEIYEKMVRKEIVSVMIQKIHPKGYLVSHEGIAGFLHRQESDNFVEGESIQAIVQNVDKRRKKVLFSSKNIGDLLQQNENVQTYLSSVQVGDQLTGTVTGIKKFGIFVNVGQIEGLVHISEMAWWRIVHPSDIVEVGSEVNVVVLAVDLEKKKLSLGMKQLTNDPWKTIDTDYAIDQDVQGKVIRLTTFGAFILIDEKIEGLLHISEISMKRVKDIESVLEIGDLVNAKVLKVSKAEQKIGLTIKGIDQQDQALAERIQSI